MKNTKIKFVLSLLLMFLFVISFAGTVKGSALPFLYVSPSSAERNTGEIMNVSVRVNPSGENVCLVEGRVVFNNLSCQSITVSGDLMAQSAPSCSNPYFLIGIPGCTLTDKNIFNISVRTGSAGQGTISFTSVDIIGEGVSLSNNSASGNYTIMSVAPSIPPVVEQPIAPEEREEAVAGEEIAEEEEIIEEEEVIKTIKERKPFVSEGEEFLMLSSADLALATIGKSPTLTTVFVLCFIILALVGVREVFLLIEKKKARLK